MERKSRWIDDNLVAIVAVIATVIIALSGCCLGVYTMVIRHDERIAANERGDATRDIKMDQILAKVSNVENLTIKLSSYNDNREKQEAKK